MNKTLRVIRYKDASMGKVPNKRAIVLDRKDGKGYILQFRKFNDDTENDMQFATSVVNRGIRYTTLSISHEALAALVGAGVSRIKAHLEK